MNRRALKLVTLALFVATLGVIAAPGVSIADPISDKQAEAQQLEAQINSNAEKLGALNEQMNSTQNELDKANADIATADALVEAAKSKTKELRAEVARRAAAVYTQSGSNSGVEELDAQNAQDLSSKQKYSSLAAQRDNEIVTALAKAKEQVQLRKADAEDARQTAQAKQDELQSQKDKLDAGQAELTKLQSKVTGELADLVAQAEAERKAREAAAAKAQYDAQLAAAAQAQAAASRRHGAAAVAAAVTTATAVRDPLPRPPAATCRRCSTTRTRSWASPTATPASAPAASTAPASR